MAPERTKDFKASDKEYALAIRLTGLSNRPLSTDGNQEKRPATKKNDGEKKEAKRRSPIPSRTIRSKNRARTAW